MTLLEQPAASWRELLRPDGGSVRLAPAGLLVGAAARRAVDAGTALALAGQAIGFQAVELLARRGRQIRSAIVPLPIFREQAGAEAAGPALLTALDRLTRPRPPLPGFAAGAKRAAPLLMGVVNVTPDSFSDGGAALAPADAADLARRLIEEGADIIDIGGESTRPGAAPVPMQQELDRVLPVVEALAGAPVPLSIDSRRAGVMRAALAAGATMVNDVTALRGDAGSLALVARTGAPVVLMHMQGDPRTMQADPRYDFAPLDIHDFLAGRLEACRAAGIDAGRIILDPGIGFGKTDRHNCQILARLGLLHGLGCPLLVGASRKSMIARLSRGEPPDQRLGGSLAAALAAAAQGAQILRIHDIAQTRQALAVQQAIAEAG